MAAKKAAVAKKTVAKKAVTKKAVTKKAVTKKAVAKNAARKKTTSTANKPGTKNTAPEIAAKNPGVNVWLVKSEPSVYSFDRFVEDGKTVWDGVRNHTAQQNLRAMKIGDIALFYHSNEGKAIVGAARVVRAAYPEPKDATWSAVDLAPMEKLPREVSLAMVKADPRFASMALVKLSRLSVSAVTPAELLAIAELAGSKTLGAALSSPSKKR